MARSWKAPNGIIAYSDGSDLLAKSLWVNSVSQPINLSVTKQQSRRASMVYPRSYAPGNITVTGRCESHTKYHELSLFIRKHQLAIIDSPVTDRFARLSSGNTSGFRRLLQLSIPHEGILQRGWIDAFSVTNRGFQDPAPEYTFQFFVIFDQMDEDIGISHVIKGVYNEDDNVYASRKKKTVQSSPAPQPRQRDFPVRKPIIDIEEGAPGGRPR